MWPFSEEDGPRTLLKPRLARLAHLADDPGVLAISVDLYDTLLLRR